MTVRRAGIVAAAAGAAAYAWYATSLRPFTWPSHAAVLIPGLAVVIVALLIRRPARGPAPFGIGLALWSLVLGVAVAWQLVNYFQAPRADHPTLSSLLNEVTAFHPARAALYLGWLALGWDLARREATSR